MKSDGDEQLMLYASLLAVLEKEFHKMSAQIPQLQIFSEREHRKVRGQDTENGGEEEQVDNYTRFFNGLF